MDRRDKYALYRKIRHDRTYRTLGKMSWWRVLLGSVLLLSILFFTGTVSRPIAARGDFRRAKALLLVPAWLETYRPDDAHYIDAGILYQDGDYAAALEAFSAIETGDARRMANRSALRLAEERLSAGDLDGAREAAAAIDELRVPEDEAEKLAALKAALGGD